MILLITPSARGLECAQALREATGQPTHVASSLEIAGGNLREQEYSAVVIDQFLLETEPAQSDQMLQHLGGAVAVYVNCGISGIPRVVREVRSALRVRQREEQAARRSAEQEVWSELKESVTAILLSCELAMNTPGMPAAAAEKIRAIHQIANEIRSRLEHPTTVMAQLCTGKGSELVL